MEPATTLVEKTLEKRSALPTVAIVGRANVGKSTLFNRLIGRRKAIVDRESGTTRDFLEGMVYWKGKCFKLVDTGGIQLAQPKTLQSAIERQVRRVMERSDLLLWVVDAKAGLVPLDEHLAELLRRDGKKTLLVANKVDDAKHEAESSVFYRMGFKDVFAISALHGLGAGDLLDRIARELPEAEDARREDILFSIAIVGEPNTGKSTYLNQILGEERALVSELPGTTRDPVEAVFSSQAKLIRLVDTAGLRLRRPHKEASGFFSLGRTREAIRRADVVLLLFDVVAGFLNNSKAIYRFVEDEGKACLLIANKWDLAKVSKVQYERELKDRVPFLEGAAVEFVSALKGENIKKPVERARTLWESYVRKIATKDLNEFLDVLKNKKPPPPTVKFKFLVQHGIKPPSFTLFVKHENLLPEEYFAFLRTQLVRHFHFEGIPVRIVKKKASNKERGMGSR